ncbi:MAG TPA: caspase family protein [Thermoanaerobaculia bacterium]|jgi:hypothetical protein
MTKMSAHFGVDNYCRSMRCGNLRDLKGAVADAKLLAELSFDAGFTWIGQGIHADADVTKTNVLNAIGSAASLTKGDVLLLTFAGYGIAQSFGRGWALYKEELPFKELFAEIRSQISDGVLVIVISASCFSGSVDNQPENSTFRVLTEDAIIARRRSEDMPALAETKELELHNPTIVHLTACGPDEVISDAEPSAFAAAVDELARDGVERTFEAFRDELERVLDPDPRLEYQTSPTVPWPLSVPSIELSQRVVQRMVLARRAQRK